MWASVAKDPQGFNQWPQVRNGTGALGGGVRVTDGPKASGPYLSVVPAQVMEDKVDTRCRLWDPVYNLIGH